MTADRYSTSVMNSSAFLVLLAALWLSRAIGAGKGPAHSDMEEIQGTWHLIYQENNGRKLPDEEAAKLFEGKMIFKGPTVRYSVQLPGFDFEFAYKLRPDRNPKEIDLEVTDTSDKKGIGDKHEGIYSLEKDSFKICFSSKGKRPGELSAGEKSGNVLIVLKRQRT
jgi:uncharacterized protein (TIGR03067 family)